MCYPSIIVVVVVYSLRGNRGIDVMEWKLGDPMETENGMKD